jgi:hypothetical protein
MLREIPSSPKHDSDLTRNLRAFILNRDKASFEARQNDHKNLDLQVLFNDMENILKSMDQVDARVQRTQAKLHELKTAVLLASNEN